MRINIPPYIKAWVAGFGTTIMSLVVVFDSISKAVEDNVVTFDEVGVIIPIIAAQISVVFGVYQVENKEQQTSSPGDPDPGNPSNPSNPGAPDRW